MGLEFTRMGKVVGGAVLGEKMENLILAVLDVTFNSHMEMLSGQSHNPRVQGGGQPGDGNSGIGRELKPQDWVSSPREGTGMEKRTRTETRDTPVFRAGASRGTPE